MKTKLYNDEPVVVKRDKLSGLEITPSKNNPEWGYMMCAQDEETFNGRTTFSSTKTALINGSVKSLQKLYKRNLDPTTNQCILSGHIVSKQCLENNIPADLREAFFFRDKTEEENIERNVKRNGSKEEGAVELTVNGLRILNFTMWDPTGEQESVIVQHDNTAEASIARDIIRVRKKTATAVMNGVTPIAQIVVPTVEAEELEEEESAI
jgi:hypothetical protein